MLTRRERQRGIAAGLIAFSAIALFVGLAVLALLGFGTAPAGGQVFTAYTVTVLRFTLLQAGLSTLLAVGLAIPVAMALVRRPDFPGRLWILRLMALPMGLPALVAALGLITVWGRQGLLNSLLSKLGLDQPVSIYGLGGILLAHVFFNLPLACRLMVAALERQPAEYWRLAASLGLRPLAVFRFIEWPALSRILPGIAGLVFMLCATSFTLVLVLGGGPAATTLEVAIYQSLRFDFDPPRAIALALLQIAVTGLVLLLLALIPANDETAGTARLSPRRFDGQTLAARAWDMAAITAATAFLLVPLCAIVSAGMTADLKGLVASPAFLKAARTSAGIALASGLLCLLLATAVISTRSAIADMKHPPLPARAFASLIGATASLVLLVPPVVLGTGWFLMLRPFGNPSGFAAWLVVGVNTLMSLPFVVRVLEPALDEHRRQTGRLVASLGMAGWWKLRHVDGPVLFKPMLTALSFAMALSLGDLGAVALFGSDDFVTLPWLLYSRLASYRTSDADGLALLLGAICLVLTMLGTAGQGNDGRTRARR